MRRDFPVLVSPRTRTDRHTQTAKLPCSQPASVTGSRRWLVEGDDVVPSQRTGFLGADPDQQAQHDVGMHEGRRAPEVSQARVQLDFGRPLGCGDHRCRLLQGQ